MLMAQITDIHIGFDPGNPDEFNRQRLDQVIAAINSAPQKPDIILATGDLTDRGDLESYHIFAEAMRGFDCPVLPCVGNHDARAAFATVFPDYVDANGFVQYVHDAGPFRLIVIDTLEEGRHAGAFCATRAAWLRDALGQAPDQPTYIVMHHPPFDSGIDWMLTDQAEPWVARFRGAIADFPQLRGALCGHLHRPMAVAWHGLTVTVSGPSAPQVTADLRPMDPDAPDNRPLIVADVAEYAMHHWNGEQLVTFFQAVEESDVLARFDERMRGLIAHLLDERPK